MNNPNNQCHKSSNENEENNVGNVHDGGKNLDKNNNNNENNISLLNNNNSLVNLLNNISGNDNQKKKPTTLSKNQSKKSEDFANHESKSIDIIYLILDLDEMKKDKIN